MTRMQLHARTVEGLRRFLAARGFAVQLGGRRGGPRWAARRFDLLVEDITVAVRVATWSTFRWQVAARGKRYRYRYRGHRWNLHTHGRVTLHPDLWIFVAAEDGRRFVVPGTRVRGFYTLTLREPSKTWLLAYEDRWDTIRELAVERRRKAA